MASKFNIVNGRIINAKTGADQGSAYAPGSPAAMRGATRGEDTSPTWYGQAGAPIGGGPLGSNLTTNPLDALTSELGGVNTTPTGVAHTFNDFRKNFALSSEDRIAEENAIRAQFQPLISEANRTAEASKGGVRSATARATRGLGYDSAAEGEIRQIESEAKKQIANIEGLIQKAILDKDAAAEQQAREDFKLWQDALNNAQKRKLDIINAKLGILAERRLQEGQEAEFTGYYAGQETLDKQKFESDDAYRKAQTDLAMKKFEEDVRQFGVETALDVARNNGVELTFDPATGQATVTDIKTPETLLTEARISEITQLLPLKIQQLKADIAKTNIANQKSTTGNTITDYLDAIEEINNTPTLDGAFGQTGDTQSGMTQKEKLDAINRIKAMIYEEFEDDEMLNRVSEYLGQSNLTGKIAITQDGVWSVDEGRYLTPDEVEALKQNKASVSPTGGSITFVPEAP